MTKFKTNREIMAEVAKAFEGDLYQIRRDASRTDEWKRTEVARTYQQMRTMRDRLTADRDAKKRDAQIALENRLFGAGSASGTDAASLVISRRDAGDRAAAIETEDEATAMLDRANRTGDEPLARAIAERAYEARWAEVTNKFLETRPHLEADMNELWSQHAPTLTQEIHEAFALMSMKPTEISGLSDFEVDRLVRQAPVS